MNTINRSIIDRFEGNFAIVELPDRTFINIPKIVLPEGAVEGDVVEIKIDKEETKAREVRIKDLSDELWE
jgi:hypothetical protein